MKRPIVYYPDADQLDIWWTNGLASGGGEDLADGITAFYDENDKIVGLTIDGASERANVEDLLMDPAVISTALTTSPIYSVPALAEEWGLQERTLRRTIETMRAAGETVGIQNAPNHPIILLDKDVQKIKAWRQAHPRGRPKAQQVREASVS